MKKEIINTIIHDLPGIILSGAAIWFIVFSLIILF